MILRVLTFLLLATSPFQAREAGGQDPRSGAADSIAADSSAGALQEGHFEKVVLTGDVTNPMELAVAPDGRVFFIERDGAVRLWDPTTRSTHMVGYVPTYAIHNEGMMGLALDPNFAENGWLYVFYTPIGNATKNELARFTVEGNRIDPESKEVLLNVPTQRQECCHSGGSIAFGPEGHLFVGVGDNTNPEELYAPLDERPGRAYWDAQRSAGNTNDLRGAILRIRPQPDGTYTIPDGNLFPDGKRGRPEIYVMGSRNPYRLSVDSETGWLYWSDIGPGGAPSEERGPGGHDEINQAREAGNYGWPYFVADNKPYPEYNFATEEPGAYFDPERPVNDSPNNTGARVLPAARPALIWYPHGPSAVFPELGVGGQVAMAGPVYHYDPATVGPHGLPARYDGTFFIYEWMRNWIKTVTLDKEGGVKSIDPFLPETTFVRPMDLELGPDGALYVIEWGTDYGGYNENAQIVRLDYYDAKQRPPVAQATAEPASGPTPLRVDFSGKAYHSQDGESSLDYAWDFDGDGQVDARGPTSTFTYAQPGAYTARLIVTDAAGLRDTAEVALTAGNTAPVLSIEEPVDGGFFETGRPVEYRVAVTDAEDEPVSGDRVVVQPYLGHDTHTHPLQQATGTEGTFQVVPDSSHAPYIEDRFAVLEANYTDEGARGGVDALTARARVVLQPQRKEAEHTTSVRGTERRITGDIRRRAGVLTFLVAEDGDHVSYAPINLRNIESLTFRVAPEKKSTIELRLDSAGGPLLSEVQVRPRPAAGAEDTNGEEAEAENWTEMQVPVTDPGGTHELFLVFRGMEEGTLLKLDWINFNGRGASGDLSEKR